MADHINQSVDDAQAINHLLSLQKALKNNEPKILAPGRKFIKEGILNKVKYSDMLVIYLHYFIQLYKYIIFV